MTTKSPGLAVLSQKTQSISQDSYTKTELIENWLTENLPGLVCKQVA
jgi:hypothetical protein